MLIKYLPFIFMLIITSGCSGVQTFPNMARAGDTVSVGMGWQKKFSRNNTVVTITPSIGEPIVYQPNDPALRAIINLYPDPVSWIAVGTDTQADFISSYGNTYGSLINSTFTDDDHDWWQTTAFVDLPVGLPPGSTMIEFTNAVGDSTSSMVEVIEGVGLADDFNAQFNGPLDVGQLNALARSSHYEVSFSGDEIPYAIELQFSSAGNLHVVNTRGSIKNLIWSEDTVTYELKIMLLPVKADAITNFHDFKFYIAGFGAEKVFQDVQPLALQSMQAFNINGEPITGVNVVIDSNVQ